MAITLGYLCLVFGGVLTVIGFTLLPETDGETLQREAPKAGSRQSGRRGRTAVETGGFR